MENDYCNICKSNVKFNHDCRWPRDEMKCPKCDSIVRQRALFYVLQLFYPNYEKLIIL